jgi:hypothetical protein
MNHDEIPMFAEHPALACVMRDKRVKSLNRVNAFSFLSTGSKAGLRGVIDTGLPGVRELANLAAGRADSGSKVIHGTADINPCALDIKFCSATIGLCTADDGLCSATIVGAHETSESAQETSKISGKNCTQAVDMLCVCCGQFGISNLSY